MKDSYSTVTERAFLISTAHDLGCVKEMILSIPADSTSLSSIRGLLLTVSADEREPFAARLLVQKLPDELPENDKRFWRPGFSEWENLPKHIRKEFDESTNFGLLRLQPYL